MTQGSRCRSCPWLLLSGWLLVSVAGCGGSAPPAAGSAAPPAPSATAPPTGGPSAIVPAGPAAPAPSAASAAPSAARRFAEDVAFLEKHGRVVVLQSAQGGRVAVSADYQGRVMTSSVAADGPSFGWVNRSFIEAGKTGTQFDNYGGEDRFWLGPEGGQFGLYFAPGAPFEFGHWQTPNAFQKGPWAIETQSPTSISFRHAIGLENYSRTRFDMQVERTIRLLDATAVTQRLGVAPPAGLQWVAYESDNRIVNRGTSRWTPERGLPSVWILAMYPPSPDTFVVIPFDPKGQGPIVNDAYFGKVPSDRLQVREAEHVVVFRCDGNHRSKIGLGPTRARAVAASYSPSARHLTIVQTDPQKAGSRYVNSMWEQQRDPYAGDVINSYNDGPTEPGKPALGGFYELETSSPGAELAPGASLQHVHRTFHFVGDPDAIDAIAAAVLGVKVTPLARGQR